MKPEVILLFALAIGCLIVSFYYAQEFTVNQWFDEEGIHFKYRDSSINYTWEQLEASRSKFK